MEPRVKRELITVLEEGLKRSGIVLHVGDERAGPCLRAEGSGWLFRRSGTTNTTQLGEASHTTEMGSPLFTTATGMRALSRLKRPKWFWVTENWFPVTIAVATLVASVAGVAVDALK